MKRFLILICIIFSYTLTLADEEVNTDNTDWFLSDLSLGHVLKNSHLMTEFLWGNSTPNTFDEKFSGTFDDVFSGEVRISLAMKQNGQFEYAHLLNYLEGGLIVANLSNEIIKKSSSNDKIEPEIWNAGLFYATGYGYYTRAAEYILYNGSTVFLSSNEFNYGTELTAYDQKYLNRYKGELRFSNSWNTGLKIWIFGTTALDLQYEKAIIMPRLKFFEKLTGSVIYHTGNVGLAWLSDELVKASPSYGPVLQFILKNAWSYGYFKLRENDINWPFESESGFVFNTVKFGLSFMI